QRVDQPIAEIGIWAGGALIDGYCLRRVEEESGGPGEPGEPGEEADLGVAGGDASSAGPSPAGSAPGGYREPGPADGGGVTERPGGSGPDAGGGVDGLGHPGEDPDAELARLDQEATSIAAGLRGDGGDGGDGLAAAPVTIAALDRLIAGSVERRLDHWRDTIDDTAWAELEEYLTWWVVKGYALRVAEQRGEQRAEAAQRPQAGGAP
ncbi:MAG: hypothetical protein ACRDY0_12610, partial [Acidimicrobiales bacterium]